jgi:hypothetical protein
VKSTFTISDASPDTFEVIWAWWGREEYRLNGKVIGEFWSLAPSGERRFEVPGHIVRIAASLRGKDYFGRAYVDDQIRIAELFPELRAKVQRKPSPKSLLKTVAIWMVVGGVTTFVYLTITRG